MFMKIGVSNWHNSIFELL